jgi:hypothetical protein
MQADVRMNAVELDRIAGYRYGFMIADMVLGDTLHEFAEGTADEDEVQVALDQHRVAYEGYVKKLHEYLTAMPQA